MRSHPATQACGALTGIALLATSALALCVGAVRKAVLHG